MGRVIKFRAMDKKRRICGLWSDYLAEWEYELQVFMFKENNHSCYSCYDDWSWRRNKCSNNCDRWETKQRGDKEWALKQAKHYGLELLK